MMEARGERERQEGREGGRGRAAVGRGGGTGVHLKYCFVFEEGTKKGYGERERVTQISQARSAQISSRVFPFSSGFQFGVSKRTFRGATMLVPIPISHACAGASSQVYVRSRANIVITPRQNPNLSPPSAFPWLILFFWVFTNFISHELNPSLANHGFMDASVPAMPPPPRTGQ
ncbi:hypothetical protein EI94DRAFT_924391 [Lactarius quietus]|nr:hypothetical protein EI94DRAFT_924391 [Lactarius quietus]